MLKRARQDVPVVLGYGAVAEALDGLEALDKVVETDKL